MSEADLKAPCDTGACEYTQGNPGYAMVGAIGETCLDLLRQLKEEDDTLEIQPGDCPYAVLQARSEAQIADRIGEF